MAKVLEVINRAFSLIGVRSSEVALTANEKSDAIETLNDMMTEQDADGLMLGYSIVESETDEVTVPDWSLNAIKANLAVLLAPEYDRQITQALADRASEAFRAIKNRAIEIGEVSFPDILPVGAGNRVGTDQNQFNFFPDEDFNDLLYNNGESLVDDRGRQLDIEVEE